MDDLTPEELAYLVRTVKHACREHWSRTVQGRTEKEQAYGNFLENLSRKLTLKVARTAVKAASAKQNTTGK